MQQLVHSRDTWNANRYYYIRGKPKLDQWNFIEKKTKIINLLWLGVQLKYILKYIYIHVFIMFCGQQTENLPQNHNRSKMYMPHPEFSESKLQKQSHNSVCVCVCELKPHSVSEQLHIANKHNQTHTHTPEHNQTKLSVTKPNQTLRGNPSEATRRDATRRQCEWHCSTLWDFSGTALII